MSSQAQACSQAPSYSLSTKWHALLWTEVSVSVSSSDTLPGRCAALQGITYYSAYKEGIHLGTLNLGVMFHPVPSVGEKPSIICCHTENSMYSEAHTVRFQESRPGIIYILTITDQFKQKCQTWHMLHHKLRDTSYFAHLSPVCIDSWSILYLSHKKKAIVLNKNLT